jgi:tetratricopeptide (TPR) repeat protein
MAPPAAYVNALLSDQMQSVTTDMIRRKRLVEAVELADESRIAADCATDISQGWLTLAKAHTLLLEDMAAVCDGYHRWVNAMKGSLDGKITISDGSGLLLESSRSQGLNTKLCLLRYGKVLLHLGRYQDVLDLLLPLCKTEPSSAILLLVGQCCLRMDRLEDAEDALQEANLLDNRNPEVWAYLSILCLSGSGSLRHAEADAAMAQAVRLGLASPALLRELAGSFMSIDQLLTAEDLIRRAISAETEGLPETDGAGANPRTRKMLGDILAGQNQAAKAVEEYMLILSDEMADADTKVAVASNCLPLLQALGRKNEIVYLNEVMRSMRA